MPACSAEGTFTGKYNAKSSGDAFTSLLSKCIVYGTDDGKGAGAATAGAMIHSPVLNWSSTAAWKVVLQTSSTGLASKLPLSVQLPRP